MHGAIDPISSQYDSGMMEMLQLMLDRDHLNRPSVTGILSHRLLVPVVYGIITGLGSLWKSDNTDMSLDDEDKSHFYWK